MLIAKYAKGNKRLELHYNEYHQLDDDGCQLVDSNWECRISDGRTVQFLDGALATMYLQQNCWELVD